MREALTAGLLVGAAVFGAVALLKDDGTVERSRAAAPQGRQVFARMGCGNCHRLAAANGRGEFGPDLDAALDHHDAASLRAKIVDPYPGGTGGGFGMPEDFGQRMTPAELEALVGFLLEAGRR